MNEYRVYYREKGNTNAPLQEFWIKALTTQSAKSKVQKAVGKKYTIVKVVKWA